MIKINSLVTPSAEQFEVVISGMRNAFKSWDKSDSRTAFITGNTFLFGENDFNLAKTLTGGGNPSHRKFLRQLPIIMNITAPEYWFKQLDTYKVGTTANSTSLMHTMLKKPFSVSDFSLDNIPGNQKVDTKEDLELEEALKENYFKDYTLPLIDTLNDLRDEYMAQEDPEVKNKIWFTILKLMPQSFNYTRTWSANYEVLLNIIAQRLHHKLPEWRSLIVYLLKNVPYLQELAQAAGIVGVVGNKVVTNDIIQEVLFELEQAQEIES